MQKKIYDKLIEGKLLFDGAFGTYYAQLYDTKELPELANTMYPERVQKIHKEYIDAGAQIIRTNTFASNTVSLNMLWKNVQDNIRNGYRLACEAVKSQDIYIAADIGQIPYDNQSQRENISKEYVEICRTFLDEGAEIFVFETFSDIEDIREAIELIGDRAFIIIQFSVNQYGYSHSGLSARKLVQQAESIEWVDAVGFNCGVGPAHMQQIINNITYSGKKMLTALPNAGYPKYVSNRMVFDNQNIDYFAQKVCDIALDGADIIGGCCGTTPEYIRKIREKISFTQPRKTISETVTENKNHQKQDCSFFAGKKGK